MLSITSQECSRIPGSHWEQETLTSSGIQGTGNSYLKWDPGNRKLLPQVGSRDPGTFFRCDTWDKIVIVMTRVQLLKTNDGIS